MSVTFPTDNRNILNEADATTGWTATDGPTLYTASPTPMESTGCLSMQVSNAVQDAYVGITSDDYSAGGTISVWMQDRAEFDTTANTGIGIQVGDGTNRIAYSVGGSDGTAFRHDTGPVKWACFVLDLANKPANFVTLAGSEASLNEAAITQVGVYFKTLVKSVGGADNVFWDIIRFADNGDDVIMQGGSTTGTAGNGSEAAAIDRSTGNQQAYGVIRELGTGVYGIQGNLTIGNAASSSDQYWAETNVTYAWEDRGLSANNYYRFKIIGSSTATNCEASFEACTFSVPAAASASFDGNGADLTNCDIFNCTFIGFDQGIQTSSSTTDDWSGNAYIDCDQVVANGCDLTGSTYNGYVGALNTSALLYNLAVDPDGELDNSTFIMGATSTHAIEFGTSVPSSMTLRNCTFSGYGTGDNANDSTFHFKDTTGTITLNLVNCSGNVSYRTDGATINIVQDPVTTTVKAVTPSGTNVASARVLLETSAGTGPLPYQESISITQSAGTATATHTAHGLSTGQYVVVRGADQEEYNKVAQVTVTGANTYTYSVDSGATTPATGSPVASAVIVYGTTDVNGEISDTRTFSSNQPVKGWIRKSTSSPYYKTAVLTGSIDSTAGATFTGTMISDE